MLCTVSKLYTSILNTRIRDFMETHKLFVEEQNGFRQNRSCEEHIFSLSSIINCRKTSGLDTFVCFVDFEKAFDKVDRDLLFIKLSSYGIKGKTLQSIKALYKNSECSMLINEYTTPWFSTSMGIKQGEIVSPTLFACFINDFATEIKLKHPGVSVGDYSCQILLFADDIALVAENENELNEMLSSVYQWCCQWRLKVSETKTKVMHFRKQRKEPSSAHFLFGDAQLELVPK